jgi:hypothetical protein
MERALIRYVRKVDRIVIVANPGEVQNLCSARLGNFTVLESKDWAIPTVAEMLPDGEIMFILPVCYVGQERIDDSLAFAREDNIVIWCGSKFNAYSNGHIEGHLYPWHGVACLLREAALQWDSPRWIFKQRVNMLRTKGMVCRTLQDIAAHHVLELTNN